MKPMRLFLIISLLLLACAAFAVPDFTFIHVTDIHTPSIHSKATISEISQLGEVNLEPYNLTVQPPSFVIVTGDLTEFGAGNGAWETYLGYWSSEKNPIYHESGNHDGTWWNMRSYIRKLHGAPFYSFDKFGCHFIGLDSAGIHDPKPNIGQEEIEWLKSDLKQVGKDTPIFVFCHHPMNSREFASDYDRERMLDVLKPYNVVLWMVGHTHTTEYQRIDGFDTVYGGSTLGPDSGFSIISVKDGVLRVAHKFAGDAKPMKPLLEKDIMTVVHRPEIVISTPTNGKTVAGDRLTVSAHISVPATKAVYQLDGGKEVALSSKCQEWSGSATISRLVEGAHSLKVTFTLSDGGVHSKSTSFYAAKSHRALWRTFLPGSCRGAPVLAGDTLYVGGDDCRLYALSAEDGKIKWSYLTDGEVCADPLVVGDTVFAASADGKLYAITDSGKLKWTFTADGGIFSSPVYADGLIFFGIDGCAFYAVDAATGELKWKSREPKYSVESKPFVKDGTVYFGAWDAFVYALDLKTGALKWKCEAAGSAAAKAARYYSPADCGPVAASDRILCADRNYYLSIIDETGKLITSSQKVSAVTLAPDAAAAYLRKTDGNLEKIKLDGSVCWSAPVSMDTTPSAPAASSEIVYACSGLGLVSAVSVSDGSILWQYQVTPLLRVYGSPCLGKDSIFVSGMDGSITALSSRTSP